MNSLFGLAGGYGTVVTVGIIAVLSVCAAFFIYRSFKGKRRKGCGKKVNDSRETEGKSPLWGKGRDDDPTIESTEGSDDGASEDFETDSGEAVTLSTANMQMPSDLLVEDLGETTQNDQTAPTEDHPAILISDLSRQHSEGHVKRDGGAGICDDPENIKVQPDLCEDHREGSKPPEDELEVRLKENVFNGEDESDEAETHGDADEPSETESAQETMDAKNVPVDKSQLEEDLLDGALLTPEAVNKLAEEEVTVASALNVSPDQNNCLEVNCKTKEKEDLEAPNKGLEKGSDCRFSQEPEAGCCARDERSNLPSSSLVSEKRDDTEVQVKGYRGFSDSFGSFGPTLSSTGGNLASPSVGYEHLLASPLQGYLGFATPCPVGVTTANVGRERAAVRGSCSVGTPVEASRDKNEINIMEAIMDSNEWLSTGPETRDLSWPAQTQSNAGHGIKTNASSVTSTASNTVSAPTTDVALLNRATTSKSNEEEDQSHEEKMVTPEQAMVGVIDDDDDDDDDDDFPNKRVAAVSPMPQLVRVSFRVHYITRFQNQLLAVTGSLRELGEWDSFVPLQRGEGGFWAGTVALPAESHAEWKFILVEDGKIRRWEECANRHLLVTGQEGEEIHLDKSWGC
ncbi:hypothetical protein P4O66_021056, partial [Electrophorus voltai]